MPRRGSLIFLLILLAALTPVLFQMSRPFLSALLLASVIAIIIHPAQEKLSLRLGRPGLATLLTTLAAVFLLASLIALLSYTLSREVAAAYNALSRRSSANGWPALFADGVDRVADLLAARFPVDRDAIRAELMLRLKSASSYLLGTVGAAVSGVTSFAVNSILVGVFLYFFLRHGEQWIARLATLARIPPSSTNRIVGAMRNSVVANVSGVFAVAAGQGLLLILGFWFVGLRAPVLWGAIGGLASLIPIVGAPLVWVPVVIGYLAEGAYTKALILGLWGAFVVGTIDNILRPLVVSVRNRQHPLLIGLAAIGATFAFGPLGFLLGPLAVSLTAALLSEIQYSVSETSSSGDRAHS